MTKKERNIIKQSLDEIMKGDSCNIGSVVYNLGKLVGRDYTQFAPRKNTVRVSLEDLPKNLEFKA